MGAVGPGIFVGPGTVVLGLLAAGFWGGGDFTGGLAARRASPFITVALAHGLSLLLLLCAALALHHPLPSLHTQLLAIFSGVLGGLSVVLFYQALAIGKMGLSAAIAGVLSAAIPVAVSFFTEGLPRPMQIAGFVLAGGAIWMIASAHSDEASRKSLGMATLAGVGFGFYFVLLKMDGREGLLWPLVFTRIGSCALATTVVAVQVALRAARRRSGGALANVPTQAPLLSPAFLGLAIATCMLDTGGNLAYTMATEVGRMDVAAVLSSLYPAGTILLAAWLLKERTTKTQALGMLVAGAAVILIAF